MEPTAPPSWGHSSAGGPQDGQQFGDGRAPPGGGGGRGFRGTAENAKTRLCNRWLQGDCRFGDRCNFAHGTEELRSLPGRGPPRGPDAGSPFPPGGYAPRGGGRSGYSPFPGRSPAGGRGYAGRGGYGGGYGGGGGPSMGGYGSEAGGMGGPPGGMAAPGYGDVYGQPQAAPVQQHHMQPHGQQVLQRQQQPYGQPQQLQQPQQAQQPQQQQQQQQQQQGGDFWPAPVEGPNGWLMYRAQDTNEPYYHHPGSGVTQWDRPHEWP